MAWLAFALLWFALSVLRGERDRFAFGALLAGFAAALLLNVVSPDALVARVNIERLEAGKRFDPLYVTLLSADAAPVLTEALPWIGDVRIGERSLGSDYTVKGIVLDRYENAAGEDWRSWNLSRYRAERLVEEASGNGR